ncbi:hypothetical protein [Longimicrobium sp.]|uniref:hypothetical protein n=1 Tax=Longimicrobium sp. TaxID=2029185 RepID=UPI002EDADF49
MRARKEWEGVNGTHDTAILLGGSHSAVIGFGDLAVFVMTQNVFLVSATRTIRAQQNGAGG